jgi:hypothetical protein
MRMNYLVETIQAEIRSPEGAKYDSPGKGCGAAAAPGNHPDKPTFSSFAPVKGECEKAKPKPAAMVSTE